MTSSSIVRVLPFLRLETCWVEAIKKENKAWSRKKMIAIVTIITFFVGASLGTYFFLKHPEKESPSKPTGNVKIFFKDPLNTDVVGNHTVYLNENVTVDIVLKNVTDNITGGSLTVWHRGPELDAMDVLAGDLGEPTFTIQNPDRTLPPLSDKFICIVNISTSISPPVSNDTVVFAKVVFRGMGDGSAPLWLGNVSLIAENGNVLPDKWSGVYETVIVKFVRSTVYLEPTVIEIQLQNDTGAWITIWNGSKTMRLVPDEPAQFFEEVYVPTGTYVASRLKYSNFITAFDATGDGDANDAWYHPHFRIWLNETVDLHMDAPWFDVVTDRIEHSIEVGYPVDVFSDEDYFNDFKQGYFRAVWPMPWEFNESASGNITYVLSYQRPIDAHMGDPMAGEPWYVEIIAKPE